MASIHEIGPGKGRVVLIVVAHANDMVLFLGGTVARWCDAGWRVALVPVTDDHWNSVALSEADTIAAGRTPATSESTGIMSLPDAPGAATLVVLGKSTSWSVRTSWQAG